MTGLDLDALDEVEPPTVTFRGVVYDLPADLPYSLLRTLSGDDVSLTDPAVIERVLRPLFGPQWDAFVEAGPGLRDLMKIADYVMTAYGLSPGESPASDVSSVPTGKRSRPTAAGSTRSTSSPRSVRAV